MVCLRTPSTPMNCYMCQKKAILHMDIGAPFPPFLTIYPFAAVLYF
jgi:hypothetical protein